LNPETNLFRKAAVFKIGPIWKPRTAVGMFSAAAWFRPEYGLLAARLAGHPGEALFNWQMVINAVSHPAPEAKPPAH
jgi:hypothetical protein